MSLKVICDLISTLRDSLITLAKTAIHFAEMSSIVICTGRLHVSSHEETLWSNEGKFIGELLNNNEIDLLVYV